MLSQLVPGPLVRFFARPYIAGESAEAALTSAILNRESGLYTTLDLLGEDVHTDAQVEQNIEIYARLIESLDADPRFAHLDTRPTVSLKPSAFTTGAPDRAFAAIRPIVELARDKRVGLTIDMESRAWTDLTLEHAIDLFEEGFDVGTVLQTRLNRTLHDLDRIPSNMRLRLVIGIYPEPSEVATTDKREMKDRLLSFSRRLLEKSVRVEFATHDDAYVERFARELAPTFPEHCEVQMLLGVPRSALQSRLMDGDLGVPVPVRVYVPFAVSWDDATAYLRRRMAESPSMIWLVLRNLFNRTPSRPPRRQLPPRVAS